MPLENKTSFKISPRVGRASESEFPENKKKNVYR